PGPTGLSERHPQENGDDMKWLKYPGLWIEIKEDKMKRQYLSFAQRVQIYNFVKTVGAVNGEHWEYKEGWSDQRVAEQFKASLGNVATVRQELGKLRTYSGAPYARKLETLSDQIISHEGILKVNCEDITRMRDDIKRLETMLNAQV